MKNHYFPSCEDSSDRNLNILRDHLTGHQNLNLFTEMLGDVKSRENMLCQSISVAPSLASKLTLLCESLNTSYDEIFLTAFFVFLATQTGEKDLVIGEQRDRATSIPIRQIIESDLIVSTLLKRINQVRRLLPECADIFSLSKELEVGDSHRHPIYQALFVGLDAPFPEHKTLTSLDITLSVQLQHQKIIVEMRCNSTLIERETLERFVTCYLEVLKGLVANPQQSLAELPCMSPQDEHTLLVEWNQTQCEFPKHLTLHRCFEQQVERTPDATALIFQHQELSYQELNHRANQLAYAIRENYQHMHGRPLEPDTPVMLYLERSLEMVVAILAVLKAGAAYVPVAPEFPQARTLFMVQDTQTSIVLTQQALTPKLEEWTSALDTPPSVLAIDDAAAFSQHPTSNLPEHSSPSDLAYILYTSGTTGQPKGVMLQHDGVVNRIHWMQKQYPLTQADRVLQKTPYVFDVSVWELLWANWVGAAIVMAEPDSHKDPQQLCQAIVQHQVTTLHFVPSMLQVFGQFLAEQDRSLPASVRWVFASGEALSATHCDLFKQVRHPQAQLHNLYGPTEASIDVTYYDCQKLKGTSVPIGQPIDNIQLYVLSEQGKPVPVGAPGELYLGGVGVARGYLHREKLTQERFVPNPFDTDGQAPRLYKTGDLVRWLPDGHLEYLGRNDFQVKIRGLRIELGEIEQRLAAHPQIEACCVNVVSTKETPKIVAYYTHKKAHHSLNDAELISMWQNIYDHSYGGVPQTKQFDLVGWNSSYTQESIPHEQMKEWVNETVQRIKEQKPASILEIGCGTGLLLYGLVNQAKHYTATDLSSTVIERLSKELDSSDLSNKVECIVCQAHEVTDHCQRNDIDTVIINSVAQYFPNIDYLSDVLQSAISTIRGTGTVMIGDIRDYRLAETFYKSVIRYQHPSWSSAKIQAECKHCFDTETELLISPEYFFHLYQQNSHIRNIEILPKRGNADHEMNRFRYDVILHIDTRCVVNSELSANTASFDKIAYTPDLSLDTLLTSSNRDIAVLGYPNARVWEDWCYAQQKADLKTKSIRSLEELFELAAQKSYHLKVLLETENNQPATYQLYFSQSKIDVWSTIVPISTFNLADVANTPQAHRHKISDHELESFLSSSLPDYMVPSAFMCLPNFPTTINGKLDRRALPLPSFSSSDDYVAPRNDLESKLCTLWAEELRIERVGINDNFFRLGGNSISAIRLIARVKQQLGIELSLALLFESKNILALTSRLSNTTVTIIPNCTQGSVPLSSAQSRLLFMEQIHPNSKASHVPFLVKLSHDANKTYLIKALERIYERHEILSTVYRQSNEGEYLQYPRVASFDHKLDTCETPHLLAEQIERDMYHPFDLAHDSTMRVRLYESNQEHYLLVVFHHIAFDGWSTDLLLSELTALYNDQVFNTSTALPDLQIQYADYSQWQYDNLDSSASYESLDYWISHLSGSSKLGLPLDSARSLSLAPLSNGEFSFRLNQAQSEQLKELAKTQETTLYTVMLSAFYISLGITSGQNDIVVGTLSDNRHNVQTQSLIGFFVNTLAIRAVIDPNQRINEFIGAVHDNVIAGKSNQEQPFDQIVSALGIEREPNVHPVCQVLFTVQHFENPLEQSGLPFEKVQLEDSEEIHHLAQFDMNQFVNDGQFDLSMSIDDSKPELHARISFPSHLFKEATIERFASVYLQVLKGFVANPQQSLAELPCMSPQDEHTLLVEWNQTQCEFPKHLTLHRCFEQQVERTPDATALIFQHQELSYQELNHRANQLAYAIRENYQHMHGRPLEPDTPVMLYLERSLEMVVAILAVLKAGAAYVPVAPEFPQARTLFMVQDTQTSIVLTQQALTTKLEEWTSALDTPPSVLAIDDAAAFAQHPTSNLPEHSSPSDLAYILYTSGTTGQPKGVMLQHDGVVNRIHWMQKQYPLTQADRVLQKTPYVFDVSVWELLWANWVGAAIVMAEPDSHKDPQQLCQAIVQHQVTTLHFVPSMLQVFGQFLAEQDRSLPASVRWVFASGEALSATHCDLFKQVRHPQAQLHNLYGPTEASIDVTYYDCQKLKGTSVPIGQPIDNIQLYVLSEQGKPVPVGAPGELYLGGVGVARGYLHREKLTQERFVPNPFDTDGQAPRLYKTGDLVRWLPDGHLEYLGRNDFQVKIRGLRIELGEIEQRLSGLEDVKHAVVTVTEVQEQPALSAYIVTHSKNELDEKAVASTLSQHLPSYMLPVSYTYLDKLPVTINGKLDRNALPAPNIHSTREYVAPSSPLERTLCEIWQEVLGVEQVSVEDNFFRLGGNSISAIRLLAITKKKANISFQLTDLFTQKTIRNLADACTENSEQQIVSRGEVLSPISFAQQSMLFIEKFESGTDAYHLPYLVQLTDGINMGTMLSAIEAIAERHQILKSVYEEHPELGEVQRYVPGTIPLYSATIDASADLDIIIRGDISQPFDLTQTYPFRLHHYIQGEQKYLLFLWHHIAFDGWSTEIFLDELSCAYSALSKQQQPQWPPLSIQYADFAQWQRDYLTGDNITSLSSYWSDHLKGYQNLSLPTDKPRPTQVRYDGDEYAFVLGAALSDQLRELARSEETTLYTVMLSAFYVTLATLSGQKDIVIGTPSDNRHNEQTHSIIGLFANTIAIRNHVTPTLTVQRLIRQVQQTVLDGKQHQDMPFDRIVNELAVERDLSRHPIFQVMFMLQSFGRASRSLPFEPLNAQGTNAFYTAAKFDLTLAIDDARSNLSGVLNFSTHLFEKSTIERFASMYLQVLKGFVANPQQSLAELPCMSPQDEHTLLVEWNQTQCEFPKHLTLHRCFEQQVERTPDATALIFQHQELSYQELNHRANQLAYAIRENYQYMHGRPLEPDTPVMLYLERSLEMVVAILAVLKAGAAYVPVAPEFPQARTLFMVQDTQTSIVLTQQALTTKLEEWTSALDTPPSVLAIDDAAAFAQHPTSNLPEHSSPSDLAYILYTSGTTGQPKGVMIEQHSIMNLVCSQRKAFHFSHQERVLLLSSFVFDASVEQVFMTLLSGAQLIVVSKQVVGDPSLIYDNVAKHNITHIHTTPAYLAELSTLSDLRSIKRVISGGDKCTSTLKQTWGERLINEYGPTETTVTTLNSFYDGRDLSVDCIGQPLDNIQIYILSENQMPLPIGAPGELHIGGVGVARGYFNRPELTRESFIPNPFVEADERMYRTGDIVRWLSDGKVEFLGRKDSQVKIRGYRIELGEIESILNAFPEVKQSSVCLSEDHGHKKIVAYVSFVDSKHLSTSSLKQLLELQLPDYMIPKDFVTLDTLPLTINGKVDHSALPKPTHIAEESYVAPRHELEFQLCQIWQDVLGIEKIGIRDNFFKVGGDSILAARVMAKINSVLQCAHRLEVHLLFSFQSIEALHREIASQLQKHQLEKSGKRMTL